MESTLTIQVQTIKSGMIKIKPSALLEVTDTCRSEASAKRLISCGKVHIVNNEIIVPIFNNKEITIYPGIIIQCGRKRIELKFNSMEIHISAKRIDDLIKKTQEN